MTHAWIADRPVAGWALHLAVEVGRALDLCENKIAWKM